MASDKQTKANRLNAEKSTGPGSPEGKAKSSMNALKTGLDAKSEVLRCESLEEREELTAEYYLRFNPVTVEERFLVDRLINAEWMHRRYIAIDAAVIERRFNELDTLSLGLVYTQLSETLGRVDRRMTSAQRNYDRTLKQLQALQAKRPQPAPEPELEPNQEVELTESDIATKPLREQLASFLQIMQRPLEPRENDPMEEEDPPIAA